MQRLTIFLMLLLLVGGCTEDPAPPREIPTPRTDAWVSDPSAVIESLATRDAFHHAIESALLPGQIADAELGNLHDLQALYATRGFKPLWVSSEVRPLNDAGESLLATLLDAEPVHGLWSEDVHLEAIQAHISSATIEEPKVQHSTPTETNALRTWEKTHPDASDDDWYQALSDPTISPSTAASIQARQHFFQKSVGARARLDILLSDALANYSQEMKWQNTAWSRPDDWSGLIKPDEKPAPVEIVSHLKPVFEDSNKVHTLLASLIPPFEQYAALTTSFQKYQAIVAAGGWEVLAPETAKLRSGKASAEVIALKERLRVEGFWTGDTTENYGPQMHEAISSYQQSHQLWEDGTVTAETLSSLNVPAEKRLNQIRVTLQRWRESRLGHDQDFIQVNIPDFHAEVWREGKREMRFRVVTGASRQKWNPKEERNEFVNATPLMSGKMDFVVFNPYWNIPNAIRRDEIEPKAAADPEYLLTERIETVTDDTGREYMRQLPGPQNALGTVKFLFPNHRDIYLHDTPDKGFFKWPTRAFSHGCVRVQDPNELAKSILSAEGKWDEDDVAAWYARPTETWIRLDKPLSVHIEYYVVRVDELGRTNFLSDVYLHDQPRLADIDKRMQARREKADKDG